MFDGKIRGREYLMGMSDRGSEDGERIIILFIDMFVRVRFIFCKLWRNEQLRLLFTMSDQDNAEAVKEAEEYNLAGNCAFKDKEYEKAIRFYNYVILFLITLFGLGYP